MGNAFSIFYSDQTLSLADGLDSITHRLWQECQEQKEKIRRYENAHEEFSQARQELQEVAENFFRDIEKEREELRGKVEDGNRELIELNRILD